MEQKRVWKKKGSVVNAGGAMYRPWGQFSEGDILVGQYVAQKTDQYDKPNWHIKVEEAFTKDKKFQKEVIGKVFGMNSAGKLDKGMRELEIGAFIQVEYKGSSEIESGKYAGKESHDFQVDLVDGSGDDGMDDMGEDDL